MDPKYKSLPIIDIQPFIEGSARLNVANQVIEACKEIGFLIIKAHQVDETVIKHAFNASKKFFDLPQNVKNKWHPKEPSLQGGTTLLQLGDYRILLAKKHHLIFARLSLWVRSTIIQNTFKT